MTRETRTPTAYAEAIRTPPETPVDPPAVRRLTTAADGPASRPLRLAVVWSFIAVGVLGCARDGAPAATPEVTPATTTAAPTTPAPATTAPATTAPTTTAPTTVTTSGGSSLCPQGESMVNDGRLLRSERPDADSRRISEISWSVEGGCHRFLISFATEDGAPATTPPTLTARILRDAGVLRIETEASSSVVVDQLVESDIAGMVFVPQAADGTRFVDLTLLQPVVARARLQTSPARLEIEIQPGGSLDLGSPLVTEDVVVILPGSAAEAVPVIDVHGYTLGPLGALELSVLLNGEIVASELVELEPDDRMWRAFSATVQLGGQEYDSLRIERPDGSQVAGIPFREAADG